MKWEDIMAKANRPRRRPTQEEHFIQVNCVNWFRLTYPAFAQRLFAVPNGGRRDGVTGAMLKAEGALAGVADLILAKPRGKYGALFIEMKTRRRGSGQSDSQKAWQKDIEKDGEYCYAVCRSLDEFIDTVNTYMAL